jgi:ParB family chromosome partitioning protein
MVEKRGLGDMTDQIELLDIEVLDPPTDAARDTIDPDKVRELAESIRSTGLLQPILVRPINGRYEIVAGHRRWLAHRLIGEVKIKAIVRELNDDEVEIIRCVENDQREDLNPIEKAKGYHRLWVKFGMTQEQIAQKMGRSRDTIIRFLKLLEIPEKFQKEVARGKISIGVALALWEIDEPSFQDYYFTAAIENGVTLDVAKAWVNDYFKTKLGNVEGYGGVGPGGAPIQEPLPIYQTCVCCIGPVEVNKVRYISVCPDCEKQIRGALKPE